MTTVDPIEEQLAHRLVLVASESSNTPSVTNHKTLTALARECLRLMEWSRRHTVHVSTDLTTMGRKTTIQLDPLTLPPEGWEP